MKATNWCGGLLQPICRHGRLAESKGIRSDGGSHGNRMQAFLSVFRTRKAGDQGVGVRLTGVQSSSAVPYASVRWTDHNNRSHSWSGEVASSDRSQIIAQIRSQTGAKQVIVQSVRG